MKKLVGLAAIFVALSAGGVANAHEQGHGARMHDGFFLQMDLGLGRSGMGAEQGSTEVDITGGAGQFSIGLGGAITPNFVLAGQLWGVAASEPDVEVNGLEGETDDFTASLSGIGVQLVYYFMPANVYISATPSITQLTFDDDGDEAESDTGFGVKLAVGKEWWVSENWALGLNGQFIYSNNDDTEVGAPSWGTTWFGLAFSATFN